MTLLARLRWVGIVEVGGFTNLQEFGCDFSNDDAVPRQDVRDTWPASSESWLTRRRREGHRCVPLDWRARG